MKEKVLLDCDPGHDDAFAIVLAAGSPAIDLLAITTVAGNQTLDKVTRNALAVCEIAGIRDVPIAAGAPQPLVRAQRTAPEIHGDSGLDGPPMPDTTLTTDPRHAVELIIDTLMSEPSGTVNLVATGPLTNLALAMRLQPAIVERVKQVIVMGGSWTRGNVTPAAEFNIVTDPEAASAVFSGGWPVTMVGLDVTHKALAVEDVQARLRSVDSRLSAFLGDLLAFFGSAYREAQGFEWPPVHDPVCIARLIDPELVTTRNAHVAIETAGQWTYGMTVVDFDGSPDNPLDTKVATDLDAAGFWDHVLAATRALSV